MWHGWIVIRNSDNAVVGTQSTPPGSAWNADFTVYEVALSKEPPVHDPSLEIISYDPSTPANRLESARGDFDQLATDVAAEIAWLDAAIPLIPAADLAQLRTLLERMARQNRSMLKAWHYVLRRL